MTNDQSSPKPDRHFSSRWQLDDAKAADLRVGADFLDRFFRRLSVQIEDGDGFAARLLTADGHLSDVDAVFAEDGADEADQTRHIVVREDHHDAVHEGIEMIGT